MKKRYFLTLFAAIACSLSLLAQGWPSQYSGVMLQGFYWDSYNDTQWSKLTADVDELSEYFDLIWIPNSAQCSGGGYYNGYYGQTMGYMPVYWFTHYNTCFGSEAELRTMINTFKAKGTGFIADVVINHRCGESNWYDFPAETWRGTTYQLGLSDICANDELANQSNMPKPTGRNDEGDNFDGARDLDHTSSNVQTNCKAYCDFLLQDLGYAGFRYDMVKGYAGYYVGMYNGHSQPRFSVGEYWDNYDNTAKWIDNTGKKSAAFDFPFHDALRSAFSDTWDMTKLCWKANGTTDQPAGLIHYGYPRYAVTFVDNHDTYREGYSKFSADRVAAANAFMLMSPGTPCVFLPHWKSDKEAIKALIKIRKAFGINNESTVNVLNSERSRYMAEVTGKKGSVVVKIGWSDADIPTSYKNRGYEPLAYGTDYCVWGIRDILEPQEPDPTHPVMVTPDRNQIEIFVNSPWDNTYVYAWDKNNSKPLGTWPGKLASDTPVTYDGKSWYLYTINVSEPSEHVNLIVNNNNGKQTDNIEYQRGRIFISVKDEINTSGNTNHYQYSTHKYDCNNPDGKIKVYIKHDWGNVNAYAYNADGDKPFGTWPGSEISNTATINGQTYDLVEIDSQKSINLIINNIAKSKAPSRADSEKQTINIMHLTGTNFIEIGSSTVKEEGNDRYTYSFIKTTTGIATPAVDAYRMYGNILKIADGASATIYTVMGARVATVSDIFNIDMLPRGVYVLDIAMPDGSRTAAKIRR